MTKAEQNEIIRRHWRIGTPLIEIGQEIGLSGPAVSARAKAIGLGRHPCRRSTPDRDERFRKMWAEGATHRAIADALGIAHGSVKCNADRLGLTPRRAVHHEKTVTRVVPITRSVSRGQTTIAPMQRVEVVRNPKWSKECDALIVATGGRYSEIERLSSMIGRPTSEINARWLVIRGRA